MLIRRIIPLLFALLVASCATTYPQPSDIEGVWEGVGGLLTPYVLFEYESGANSHLVMGGVDPQDQEEFFFVITLSDFTSRKEDFTLLATFKDEETGETQSTTIYGQVFSSQLVLHLSEALDEEEQSIWFIRPAMLDASRLAARIFLNLYKESE